ncbi:MAG: SHOCT domain-containing protein [Candidatus Saccharimonadales bacterium]
MKPEQLQREKDYYAALAIAGQLLKRSLITQAEYKKVEEALVKKYRPVIGSLKYAANGNPPQKQK